MSEPGQRVRITIDLSIGMNAKLEVLAAEKETTKADMLRFAVDLMHEVLRAKRDGFEFVAVKNEAGMRVERMFVGI